MAHQAATSPSEAVSSPRPASASGAERRNGARHTYGALDLGTNNCRLLIARPSEGGFTVVDAFSRIVRLGEGLGASGRLSDASMDRAVAALAICADKLRRRNVTLARSVATEACRRARQRRRLRRPRPPRDRRRARNHPAEGGSAAGRARLPQIARARRRPGADLRHWRRLDRTGAGRPWRRRHAAHHRLVVGAVGRGVADRDRGPRSARGPRPRRGLQAHARARAAQLPPLRRHAARATRRTFACSAPAAPSPRSPASISPCRATIAARSTGCTCRSATCAASRR